MSTRTPEHIPPKRKITSGLLGKEIVFTTSRSSGPGGQNVNKVNTKVTLKFDVTRSAILTAEEKEIISAKLHARITTDGVLLLTSQDKRSQLDNKQAVVDKFNALIAKAFEKKKVRKKTKPSKGAVETRITGKKHQSEKKKWRQKLN
jgi:ribosome-associated protein